MSLSSLTMRARYSRWLWRMGASAEDSLKLVASYNSRMIRRRLGLPGVNPITVRIIAHGTALPFRFSAATDFTVLGEVFRERQYELPAELRPRTIVDLGANSGLTSLYFHARFPDATIYAIEAHPATFHQLKRNAKLWSNVRPLHLAAAGHNGTVEFFGTPGESISASVFQRRSSDQRVQVPGEDLSTLLNRCGPRIDLLKFDIEGAEIELFANFKQWDRIGVLIGEVHPDLYGGTVEQFFALFPRHSPSVIARVGERVVARFDPLAAH